MPAKKTAAEKTKAKANGNANLLPGFVKDQIEDAQKRFAAFETEAQKVLENLIERGRESRKELDSLVSRFNTLEKKASQAGTQARKRLDQIQNRVIEGVGVASQSQVQQINRELVKLSKKLDQLVGKKEKAASAKSAESRNQA